MTPDLRAHRAGAVAVIVAACFWSTSGLFVRWISAELLTMLFWRGLFSGTGVFVFYYIMEGGRIGAWYRHLGWPGLVVMAMSAMSMICGIGAIRYTTAAEALSIYATLPFVTAAVAWAMNGERPGRATLVAAAVAFAGVLVILKDAEFDGSTFGKLLAVFMTLGMAIATPVIRRHPDLPMTPAMGLSAYFCSSICALILLIVPAAGGFAISAQDLGFCVAFGVIQNATGLALYAVGSKHLRSAEATLLAAIEVPLTPLWVWLFLAETPGTTTLVGGGIVISAMLGHIAYQLGRERRVIARAKPIPPPSPRRYRLITRHRRYNGP